MPVRIVGLCGADDSVDPAWLVDISSRYPWLEWGVLCRPDLEGSPRYASKEWLSALGAVVKQASADGIHVRLACHLCGARVPQVLGGDASFVQEMKALGFRRFQVNATAINGVDTSSLASSVSGLRRSMRAVPDVEFIIQRNEETKPIWEAFEADPEPNMSFLYDASCGTGVVVTDYPSAANGIRFGYAGGIGPDNLASLIPRMNAATAGNDTVWIDMESSLRSVKKDLKAPAGDSGRDVFDIAKALAVAHTAVQHGGLPAALNPCTCGAKKAASSCCGGSAPSTGCCGAPASVSAGAGGGAGGAAGSSCGCASGGATRCKCGSDCKCTPSSNCGCLSGGATRCKCGSDCKCTPSSNCGCLSGGATRCKCGSDCKCTPSSNCGCLSGCSTRCKCGSDCKCTPSSNCGCLSGGATRCKCGSDCKCTPSTNCGCSCARKPSPSQLCKARSIITVGAGLFALAAYVASRRR